MDFLPTFILKNNLFNYSKLKVYKFNSFIFKIQFSKKFKLLNKSNYIAFKRYSFWTFKTNSLWIY